MTIRALLVAAALTLPQAAAGQTVMRAETPPAVVAGDADWYRAGEPVLHRGELYYPGGAQTFFDGNRMVLVGEFRGVPLYADPTIETGSMIYVPVSGKLLQPYERLRAGELAGTSGSRTPSYPPITPSPIVQADDVPVATLGIRTSPPQRDAAGRVLPPAQTVSVDRPEVERPEVERPEVERPEVVETIAPAAAVRGRGIWIEWDGTAWSAAGAAVRIGPQFTAIGSFNGRTVYRGPDDPGTIWIETAQGLATPWKR